MSLTGTLLWALRSDGLQRGASLYTTDCYVDRLGGQWIVLVIRGPETVLSETCDSEAEAMRRAGAVRETLLRHGWTATPAG